MPAFKAVDSLTFAPLWANSAEETLMVFFSYFYQKKGFDI